MAGMCACGRLRLDSKRSQPFLWSPSAIYGTVTVAGLESALSTPLEFTAVTT